MPNTSHTHKSKKNAVHPQPTKGTDKRSGAAPDAKNQEPNEGEGSRTGARQYNAATEKYVQSGRVPAAAEDAKRAVDGPDGEALRAAEREGRRHAKGE